MSQRPAAREIERDEKFGEQGNLVDLSVHVDRADARVDGWLYAESKCERFRSVSTPRAPVAAAV